MSDTKAFRRTAIEVAVLRYLAKHPDASDAAVGICSWWLPEEGVHEEPELVEEVLEGLAQRGLIRRFQIADGTFVYRGLDAGRRPI